jgi:hypothetical protein
MRKTKGPRRRGVMGRGSIFRGKVKDKDHRVQGILTRPGLVRFKQARANLARLYRAVMEREPAVEVSDADTIEYLAWGELETRRYLREQRATELRIQRARDKVKELEKGAHATQTKATASATART